MTIITPFLPGRFQGYALFGWLIIIKKGHERLIPHEELHLQQQRLHGRIRYHWRYIFDKDFRARMEIQAYRIADGLNDLEIAHKLRTLYGVELDPNRHWGVWR